MNGQKTPSSSSSSSANRALVRLAVRGVKRHRGRSALIVALLAVPVAAAIVAASGSRALFATPEQQTAWYYGASDVVVQQFGSLPTGDAARGLDVDELRVSTGLDAGEAQKLADWLAASDGSFLARAVERMAPAVDIAVVERSWAPLGSAGLEILGMDPASPITDGMVVLESGAWPSSDGELTLTPRAAEFFGVGVGDDVTLPDLGALRVSGIHLQSSDARASGALVRPGVLSMPPSTEYLLADKNLAHEVGASVAVGGDTTSAFYQAVEAETGADVADILFRTGNLYAAPTASFFGFGADAPLRLDRPPVLAGFVAAVLLLEVGLVAAAAHAAGARRRLREFGLLATIGADLGHIRRLVLVEAVALGVVSVLVGSAGGVLATWALSGAIADLPTHVVGPVRASAGDLVAPSLIALVAAIVAAWWPAHASARVPALSALAGRMPTRPLRLRAVPWAVALSGAGLLILAAGAETARRDLELSDSAVLIMVVGSLLVLAGSALGGTWLVGRIAAHADHLPLHLRLVARDAGRQQFRSAMAIAGLVVVLAAPIGVAAAVVTAEADSRESFVPVALDDEVILTAPLGPDERPATPPASLVATIEEVAPGSIVGRFERLGVRTLIDDGFGETESIDHAWMTTDVVEDFFGGSMPVALGTPEAVAALRLGPEAQQLLDAGKVVAVGSAVPDGPVQLQLAGTRTLGLEAVAVGERGAAWGIPGYLIPQTVAAELQLEPVDTTTVFVTDAPVDAPSRDLLWDIVPASVAATNQWSVSVGEPFDAFSVRVQQVALPIALGVVIIIGGCLIAIAATESDRDVTTMMRIGAAPGLRRRFLGLQGWYHAAVAAMLATPVGLLMLVALRRALADPPPLVIPWVSLGAVVVAIPVILGLVVAAMVRTRPMTSGT